MRDKHMVSQKQLDLTASIPAGLILSSGTTRGQAVYDSMNKTHPSTRPIRVVQTVCSWPQSAVQSNT
ncbi:hypothetical protein PILCRDRAFT_306614 [Piloderma croceum F 1598]|uniref:Uncharacterized protein n=1 Tax=Piloderma croceum (strain F 1598) TaxID=765440 RepID=A0A0C3FQU4_PILCF|nr:hypothetical protein PILCRDRAFT_306614 [Piloderma croceum F 1598]